MRYFMAATLVALLANVAHAQKPTCKLQSIEKKLAGPALKAFMKKCGEDAETACDKSADDRKLEGAAKSIYTKKCVTSRIG